LRAFAAAVLALLAVTSMANAQQEGVYTILHYKFETGHADPGEDAAADQPD
jgi:hypothetical protein